MALRVGNIISKMIPEEADAVNQNFNDLFRVKLEATEFYRVSPSGTYFESSSTIRTHQTMIHGTYEVSRNGSSTVEQIVIPITSSVIALSGVLSYQVTLVNPGAISASAMAYVRVVGVGANPGGSSFFEPALTVDLCSLPTATNLSSISNRFIINWMAIVAT